MILDVEDTATGLRCTAHTDTAYISPADTEALLRHLERIAVDARSRRQVLHQGQRRQRRLVQRRHRPCHRDGVTGCNEVAASSWTCPPSGR